MLPNEIIRNPRIVKIWTDCTGKNKQPQIAGYLLDGTYWQSYSHEHLARNAGAGIVNMKGMDLAIYRLLQSKGAKFWRIVEQTTKRELYIPFKSIGILLEAHVAKEKDIGYGLQIFVPLDRFSEIGHKPQVPPAIQHNLL